MSMERTELIATKDFCVHHGISITFITELSDAGLVEIVTLEEEHYIHCDQASDVEKLVRLHNDLEINVAGVEVIARLLQQVEALQSEVGKLHQRLRLYER